MLCFCNEPSRMAEVYPEVVEAFLREFRLWVRFSGDPKILGEGFRLLSMISDLTPAEVFEADSSTVHSRVLSKIVSSPQVFAFAPRIEDTLVEPQGKDGDHGVKYSKTEGKEEDACVVPSTSTTEDVFTFGANLPAVEAMAAPHDTAWVESGMCSEKTDLDKVFSRPIKITSGVLSASSADHVLVNTTFPGAYFKANALARDKLRNYAYLRCTVCIRVAFSSAPLYSGKMLAALRYGVVSPVHVWEAISDISVEMDLSTGSAAVLKAPTVLPMGWSLVEEYDSDRTKFDFLTFVLFTLTQTSASVGFTVYAWLEDVDLRMPMYGPPLSAHGGPDTIREVTSDVFATASSGIRSFQGVLVDVVSIIDTAAKFAAMVGLSMPAASEKGMLMNAHTPQPHFPHLVGATLTSRLATVQEQKTVQPMGTWGCRGDDMDVRSVCSRPGILAVGNYNTAGFVTSWWVNPGAYCKIGSTSFFSHLAWTSLFFRMWRGTIKYRIALAKTAFHAGVLEVIYQPGRLNQVTTVEEASLNHRWSWDISQSSSFEFEIPFSSPISWSDVRYQDANAVWAIPADPSFLTGCISIIAVTAPSVVTDDAGTSLVSDNIPYVVYTWSDDIEFAVPSLLHFSPDFVVGRQIRGRRPKVEPQVGPWGDSVPDGVVCKAPTRLFRANPVSLVTNASCVGEVVPNLRSLTRRPEGSNLSSDNFSWIDLFTSNDVVRALSYMYLYFSGGVRGYLGYSGGPVVATRLWRGASAFTISSQYLEFSGSHGLASVDLPWQAPIPFFYISQVGAANLDTVQLDSSGFVDIYPAGADDFTFGMLIAPPSVVGASFPADTVPDFDYCEPTA